jgi:hypothetical protein
MHWWDADTLVCEYDMDGADVYVNTVVADGMSPVALPPVRQAVSPEFLPEPEQRRSLMEMAAMTGGKVLEAGTIWENMATVPTPFPLAPWLGVVAMLLLLLEVAERHLGWLEAGWRKVMVTVREIRDHFQITAAEKVMNIERAKTEPKGTVAPARGIAAKSAVHGIRTKEEPPPSKVKTATADAETAASLSSAASAASLRDALRKAKRQ